MKRKDLVKKLQAAGYRLDRNGDHSIFEKEGGRPVQVPNHREINEYTAKAILKAAGINQEGG
jgi:mRNA interferase HicA